MNKALSIVLCYAIGMAAYCIHAADPVASIDFDDDAENAKKFWGLTPHWGLSDAGDTGQEATHWWTSDADGVFASNGNYSVMREFTSAEKLKRYDGFDETDNPQPSYMKAGEENLGFLPFLTAIALYRTIGEVAEDGTSTKKSYSTGCDIFFDQLVQFTRRDEKATESIEDFLPPAAKFACWVPSDTNALVVTAGRYARDKKLSVLYATNYLTTANIVTGRWYRLTARTIKDASMNSSSSTKTQALVVYLDGKQVTCGDDYQIGDDADAVDNHLRGNLHYEAHALFPSLTKPASIPEVYGLAVCGEGAIDEIGVSAASNPLVTAPEGGTYTNVDLYVSVDPAKITNVVVKVTANGETEPYLQVETERQGLTNLKVKPQDKVRIVPKAIADAALGDKIKFGGNTVVLSSTSSGLKSTSYYEFTMQKQAKFTNGDPVIARVDTQVANFDVDGVCYETVADALDAAWGKSGAGTRRLTLRRDLTLAKSATADNGQLWVLPKYTKTMTFDLNGHWIRGDHFREEAAIYTQGLLTIVDSVGGGGIVAAGKAIEVASTNVALEVNYTNAVVTLGDREITGDFTVTGRVVCLKGELILKGGSYVTPTNLMPTTEFYLDGYVAPERFYAFNDTTRDPTPGQLWSVRYDGRYRVDFEVPHGGADPAYTNVDTTAGAFLAAPAITNAAGYAVTNWYVKGVEPQLDWKLATDAVTNDMTLVAQQKVEGYSIAYSKPSAAEDWPTSYTVESALTELPTPDKIANYSFVAWHDRTSDRDVAAFGAGAKWPGTDETVASDLDLVGRWQPDMLSWTDIGSYSVESNGYYAGTWRFTVPASATLAAGTEVVVDEIDFGVVNPNALPKSAEFLAVTPNGGAAVVSAARPLGYDSASGEYAASTNVMANGRVRLAYRFSGLVVRAGEDNVAQFSSAAAAVTPVTDGNCFLRLAVKPAANDAMFGNCTESAGYQGLCPVYEVSGHVKGDVE